MSHSQLSSLVRGFAQSDPADRPEQSHILEGMKHLRPFVRSQAPQDLASAYDATGNLVKLLTIGSEHLDVQRVHAMATELLGAIERGFAGHAQPHSDPGHGHDHPGHDDPGHHDHGHDDHVHPGHDHPGHGHPGNDHPGHDGGDHGHPHHVEDHHAQQGQGLRIAMDVPEQAAEPAPEPAAPAPQPTTYRMNAMDGTRVPVPMFDGRGTLTGRILIELGHVTHEQVEEALEVQRQRGLRLGECLLLMGAVTPDRMLEVLKLQESMRALAMQESSGGGMTRGQLAGEAMVHAAASGAEEQPLVAHQAQGNPVDPGANVAVSKEMFFGEVLLGAEMVTRQQLEQAMHMHHHEGLRVGEALIQIGALTPDQVEAGLALKDQLQRIAGLTPTA